MKTLIIILLLTSICSAQTPDKYAQTPDKYAQAILDIHQEIVKIKLDIQESRDREEKLAQYLQQLDYQISVISDKDQK